MRRAAAVVVFLSALLAAGMAADQQTPPPPPQSSSQQPKSKPYALIFGTVYGPDDRPLYGAEVRIRLADGKKVRGGDDLMSDHQGEFALRVPAEKADYVVRAAAKVKKRKLKAEVKVQVDFDERVDIGLHLSE